MILERALELITKPLIVFVEVGPENAPAEVIVPDPVVEIFPVVVNTPEELIDHAVPPVIVVTVEALLLPILMVSGDVPFVAILTVSVPSNKFPPILIVFVDA